MNKKQLISEMAEKAGITLTDAGKALDAFVDTVSDALKAGDNVQLTGFCTIQASKRAAREGVNPATGGKIKIAAKTIVKFKAGKTLTDSLQ